MKEGNKCINFPRTLIAILIVLAFIFYVFNFFQEANAGVPKILSFQGRLTNASGDLQGGNGTNFYFKFAIYDTLSGGTKLWPSGAPPSITIKVTQGVFNSLLGDTSAGYSAIDLDFDSSNYYLEIQASSDNSTFETLTSRQRIVASGFAINAETVHGGRFLNTSGVGQFAGATTLRGVTYTWPSADGTSSYVFTTNGAGILTWE